MPTYHFHIRREDKLIRDEEGVEMSGPRAALEEAQQAAREILAEKLERGEIIDGDEFEVYDELGTRLFNLPFKSVLRLD